MVYQSIQKIAFYVAGTECTLYCDYKQVAPFFTMGMSSPLLDRLMQYPGSGCWVSTKTMVMKMGHPQWMMSSKLS